MAGTRLPYGRHPQLEPSTDKTPNAYTTQTQLYEFRKLLAGLTKNIPAATLLGRGAESGGPPEPLTAAEVTALLALATALTQGLVPPISGVSTEYLDGTLNWSTPAGGGGGGLSPLVVAGLGGI